MKLVTYLLSNHVSIGAMDERGVSDLSAIAPDMLSLIATGPVGLDRARALFASTSTPIPLGSVTLLAPIPQPHRNIMCVGLNYAEHARESADARGRNYKQHQHPV